MSDGGGSSFAGVMDDNEKHFQGVPPWTAREIEHILAERQKHTPKGLNWLIFDSLYKTATGNRTQGREILSALRPEIERLSSDSPWWQAARIIKPAFYALDMQFIEDTLTRYVNAAGWTVRVGIAPEPPDKSLLLGFHWQILAERTIHFLFNPITLGPGYSYKLVDTWVRMFPFFRDLAADAGHIKGRVFVNCGDEARIPGLGFSAKSDDVCLIPDVDFVGSRGYREFKRAVGSMPSWERRREVGLWRGTVWNIAPGGWASQQRTKLCMLGLSEEGVGVLDAGITGARSAEDAEEVKRAGLFREPIPPVDFANYKYQIDIDGFSNAWSGLFQKLCTGGVVLKVMSGFRQWYYERLIAWENYVPVAPEMDDLLAKLAWLKNNDVLAQRIGVNGQCLAMSMSYEEEVSRAKYRVSHAMKNI